MANPFSTPNAGVGAMQEFELDMTGVESSAGALDVGTHLCRIKSYEGKQAANGTDMIVWVFEAVVGDEAGKTIFHNTFIGEKSRWTTLNVLEAAQQSPDPVTHKVKINKDLIGRFLMVQVSPNTYQDKESGEVKTNVKVGKLAVANADLVAEVKEMLAGQVAVAAK